MELHEIARQYIDHVLFGKISPCKIYGMRGVCKKEVQVLLSDWIYEGETVNTAEEHLIRRYTRRNCGTYCGLVGSVCNILEEENQSEHGINRWWDNYRTLSRYLKRIGLHTRAKVECLVHILSEEDMRITGMIDA